MKLDIKSGLFSVDQLSTSDLDEITDRAAFYKKRFKQGDKKVGGLNGRRMINMFFEPSTRTRISFETAAKSMGMLVSNIIADASAMTKGETAVDTLLTINAMNFDAVIIRTSQDNLPYELSRHSKAAIINAGDGRQEHPTQAMLDYFTIKTSDLSKGAETVAIVGNLVHSRVARSNAKLLTKAGYNVILCGPDSWLPTDIGNWGDKDKLTITDDMSVVIGEADVVMALRVQKERFSDMHRGLIDLKQYNNSYGIKRNTLRPDVMIMHPGPVNRNIEIDEDMIYSPQSVILDQVENGVAVRAAVLEHIIGE